AWLHAVAAANGQTVHGVAFSSGLAGTWTTIATIATLTAFAALWAIHACLLRRRHDWFGHQQWATALSHQSQRSCDFQLIQVFVLGSELLHDFAEGSQILATDGLIDAIGELLDTTVIDRIQRRQLHLGHRLAGSLLDGTQQVLLAWGHEQDRVALTASTAGTANAVHVGLGVM